MNLYIINMFSENTMKNRICIKNPLHGAIGVQLRCNFSEVEDMFVKKHSTGTILV